MADRTLPGIGLKGFWALGENGWKGDMDSNLLKLSSLVEGSALSQVTALPGSPSDGNIYIVPSSAGSHPNDIAVRDAGAWVYFTPLAGWRVFVADIGGFMTFDGTEWTLDTVANIPVDPSSPTAGDIVLHRVTGEVKSISATGDITSLAIDGWAASGVFSRLILELLNAGAHTVTLPDVGAGYLWASGSAPTVLARNVFIFFSLDGGSTVYASTVWQA